VLKEIRQTIVIIEQDAMKEKYEYKKIIRMEKYTNEAEPNENKRKN